LIEKGYPMLRKVSTLLVLATVLVIGACDDEIVTDAIPVADAAASDHASEASKEGGDTDAAAAEGGTSTGDGSTAESAAPEGGSKPDAAANGDGATEAAPSATDAASDAPPG
jgi:hypothetical protein